jgi:spore germination protein YaaH
MFYSQMTPFVGRTKDRLDGWAAARLAIHVPSHPGRRLATLSLALLVAVAGTPTAGPLANGPAVRAATEIRPRITGIAPLTHEVYGYLPYWRLDAGTVDRIRYELVSTIAFFGLGIKATGALDTAWVGYQEYVGDDAAAVTNAAHDRGVRVVPTFQLFDTASGAPKMTAFLDSTTAQDRFIREALDLMAARKADGAGLDFEPVGPLAARAPQFSAFVARFRRAMKARFPTATLVNATSAGATEALVKGVAPNVDHQMVMTYNYRWTGSKVTGAIAPLDHATRNVKDHIGRMISWVPAKSLLLGVPYYGYDWPVTSDVPNATVQTNKTTYGAVRSVTYAGARAFLAAHPEVVRRYDSLEGSGFYTYWDSTHKTFRQVYFEEERSLTAKYDYAIATGLGGIGIWTLDNDRGYDALANVLRAKFYAPVYQATVKGSVTDIVRRSGVVYVKVHAGARNTGTVPLTGSLRWSIRNRAGRVILSGRWPTSVLYPGRATSRAVTVKLGLATRLAAGTYTLRVRYVSTRGTWGLPDVKFRQPY